MTLKDLLGYVLCAAGIGLFIAAMWFSLGWGWAVFGVVLFVIGWFFLRSERRNAAESIADVVDAITDIDLD